MANFVDKDGYHRGCCGSYIHVCPVCPKGTLGAELLRIETNQQWCLKCFGLTILARDPPLLRTIKRVLKFKPTYPTDWYPPQE